MIYAFKNALLLLLLHNFIRAHEDNDIDQGLSRRDISESSEVIIMKWHM